MIDNGNGNGGKLDNNDRAILDKFANVAALAGLRCEMDEDDGVLVTGFEMPRGRSQLVYARALSESAAGQDAVCVFSPCRRVKRSIVGGLTKRQGLELLQLNSELLFARYGIVGPDENDELMVIASADCLVDTLDPEECEALLWCVALAADSYEERFGGDEF